MKFMSPKFVFVSLALSACAHGSLQDGSDRARLEDEVEKSVSRQPSRSFHGGVAMEGYAAIDESKKLPEERKRKLRELERRVASQTFAIQDEMSKVKGALFETLSAEKYEPAKLDLLKARLLRLNERKIDIMMKALEEAKSILSEPPSIDPDEFYRSMLQQIAN